jgi:hypothetical protein
MAERQRDPGRWWADLYGWLETEIVQMDRLAVPGPDDQAISAQAHELRFVREHMRGVDPALPSSEVDRAD